MKVLCLPLLMLISKATFGVTAKEEFPSFSGLSKNGQQQQQQDLTEQLQNVFKRSKRGAGAATSVGTTQSRYIQIRHYLALIWNILSATNE